MIKFLLKIKQRDKKNPSQLNCILYITFQSNGEVNESEMSDNASENGEVDSVRTDKLDIADRDLYEKLKRQEREEREEIEKELKRAHEEAIIRRHEELRAKELRLHAERLSQLEAERGQDLRVGKHHEDYRLPRDGHPLVKSDSSPRLDLLSHSAYLDRAYHQNSRAHSPQSATSASPTDGPTHHWTFEEQFKQVPHIYNFPVIVVATNYRSNFHIWQKWLKPCIFPRTMHIQKIVRCWVLCAEMVLFMRVSFS